MKDGFGGRIEQISNAGRAVDKAGRNP